MIVKILKREFHQNKSSRNYLLQWKQIFFFSYFHKREKMVLGKSVGIYRIYFLQECTNIHNKTDAGLFSHQDTTAVQYLIKARKIFFAFHERLFSQLISVWNVVTTFRRSEKVSHIQRFFSLDQAVQVHLLLKYVF